MDSIYALFLSGLALGTSSGLSPGPLLTLTIAQSMRYGYREGIKIAAAPIITDLPIILIAVYLLSRLSNLDSVLGLVAMSGAAFLVYLSWESLTFKGAEFKGNQPAPRSWRKGVITNFLNPAPYLFWLTIGGAILVEASDKGALGPSVFLLAMYFSLVGSKIVIAVLVGNSKMSLKSRGYIFAIRLMGIILLGFALKFAADGLEYFGLF